MLPLDSASSRPACRRRQAPIRSRPILEHLEPRLPPGDALLGILAGWSVFETGRFDQELFSSAPRLARTPNLAATSATVAEVAALSAPAGAELSAGRVLVMRRPRLSNSESAATNPWNDSLTDFAGGPMPVGRSESLAAERGMGLELTPMVGSPIGGMQAANPAPVQRGLSAVVVMPPQAAASPAAEGRVQSDFAMPFYFEKNMGQAGEGFDFVARGAGYALGLSATEAVMAMQAPTADNAVSVRGSVVRMQLVGGNSHATVAGADPLITKVNYFLGSDPDHWHTNVPTFGRVQYDDVYPGIDLVYYGNNGQLEYDFIVSPGADPNAIRLNFAGADGVEVNGDGDLVLHTTVGDVVQQSPLTYQQAGSARQVMPSRYVIDGGRVRFHVGAYDASRPLVIDPLVLGYSTYLGGGGTLDTAYDIAVDNIGYAYVVGETRSVKFPVTDGAFDESYNGGTNDAFVAKLNQDGSVLMYATYLGGVGNDQGQGIAVDAEGNAYATGSTWARDFPTTLGAFDQSQNSNGSFADVFVTKLNPDGNGLVYSTFVGGRNSDFGGAIALDVTGSAYITGSTDSTNFPVTPGALDTSYNGGVQDVFVAKLNPDGGALSYATYLGGSDNEVGFGVTVDANGRVYIAGTTESLNFPTTLGAFDTTFNGDEDDGFVAKLSVDGDMFEYSTYLGGASRDSAGGIAVDSDGNAFVSGGTQSVNFPVTPGAYDTQHNVIDGGDGFVSKLNYTGSGLMYSTFLGAGSDGAGVIALDGAGNAYVAGMASSGLETTADAFDKTPNGGGDAFLMKLNVAGSALTYSTYLGGSNSESTRAIALDVEGSAYVAGDTRSGDFPTTPNALKRRNRPTTTDGFVTKFAEV